MAKVHLTDEQWAFIQALLPPPARTARPRVDDRRTVDGIFYALITGCYWQDLPREFGAPTTAWRRLKRWGEADVCERIWRAALVVLDLLTPQMDGNQHHARDHAPRALSQGLRRDAHAHPA